MPDRITTADRARFHEIVDRAIDKMNAPRNAKKPHWSSIGNYELIDLEEIEVKELRHAVDFPHHSSVVNECYDVINYALMIADNAMKGK